MARIAQRFCFYRLTALRGSGWLSFQALFSLKALRSPVALQKLLHCFSAAYALKIQRKIFAAAAAYALPRLAQRL
ncbi:MAG: hypothetical protein MR658_07520 [Campylobacter sp.]|uniref:hypothetical protein n=1 Tax=Campylobacter sp. TaxID=205 RepID=UPI002AA8E18F|nr:hypothetical protein [Campylobacter sp.]MCI6178655.1 hypothetical protein [Campylobacter sp.]